MTLWKWVGFVFVTGLLVATPISAVVAFLVALVGSPPMVVGTLAAWSFTAAMTIAILDELSESS